MKTTQKKILPAFILSTVFGPFGAHRLYAGKIATGLCMLVLGLSLIGLFVTAIWNFIDWVMILTGNFTDSNGVKITQWT